MRKKGLGWRNRGILDEALHERGNTLVQQAAVDQVKTRDCGILL
jgi:hypothetical protein